MNRWFFLAFSITLYHSCYSQDFLKADDTLNIEFEGRVIFVDSNYRDVAISLKRNGELVSTTNTDTSGHYFINCNVVAQCELTLHFCGEGLLEKWISFDLTSDSISVPPSNFRPIHKLDIDMVPLNSEYSIQSIEVAKFGWNNRYQYPTMDTEFVQKQRAYLRRYNGEIIED